MTRKTKLRILAGIISLPITLVLLPFAIPVLLIFLVIYAMSGEWLL